jgi:transposase-like protein
MKGHGSKFGRKKEEAIAALLTQQTIENAARSIGIGLSTLLRWQKDPEFDAEYRAAQRAAYRQTTARLQQASPKLMVDSNTPASVRARTADSVLSHAAKAIEIQDLDARLAALEAAAASGQHRR